MMHMIRFDWIYGIDGWTYRDNTLQIPIQPVDVLEDLFHALYSLDKWTGKYVAR